MKYFGCIKQQQFEKLSQKEQFEYLQTEGVYVQVDTFTIPQDGTPVAMIRTDATKRTVPNKMVIEEFYQFAVRQFEPLVSQQFYNFYLHFNEEKYGHKKSKQKQIALKHFKNHYDLIATKVVRVMTERLLENGETVLENMNKLAFLKTGQNALKSELCKSVLLQQFLFGNRDHFVAERIEEHDILRNVIKFEGVYKILSSLNSQYNFEQNGAYPTIEEKHQQKTTIPSNKNTTPETLENQPSISSETGKHLLFEEAKQGLHKKPSKKPPLISDEAAIEYLLQSVFGKKNIH